MIIATKASYGNDGGAELTRDMTESYLRAEQLRRENSELNDKLDKFMYDPPVRMPLDIKFDGSVAKAHEELRQFAKRHFTSGTFGLFINYLAEFVHLVRKDERQQCVEKFNRCWMATEKEE